MHFILSNTIKTELKENDLNEKNIPEVIVVCLHFTPPSTGWLDFVTEIKAYPCIFKLFSAFMNEMDINVFNNII